jgi:tetratricopeptide (TPR) repeat protein
VARIEAAAQPTAPAGAVPQTGKPRALTLSASGIPLEPPEPLMGKGHWLSLEASRLLTAGKPAEAREVFVKLAKDDPKDARLPYGIALTFFLEGKDADAREQDAEALELAPEFADAHLLAAFLDQLSGNEAEAKTHYEAFLTTESSSPRAEDVRLLVERLTPR